MGDEMTFTVEDEQATGIDHGTITELQLRVSVSEERPSGAYSIIVFDVVFDRRGQSGPLHWASVTDQSDSDWFGPTHCAVVLHAADYVEENYEETVDTKQIER